MKCLNQYLGKTNDAHSLFVKICHFKAILKLQMTRVLLTEIHVTN